MNTRKSTIACMALAVGAFSGVYGVTTNNCEWGTYSSYYWTSGTWSNGNIARVTFMKNGGWDAWDSTIEPYKVIFDTSSNNSAFWMNASDDGDRGRIVIGAGGAEFVRPAVFSIGYRSNWYSGLGLNGSQTWGGTESGTYANAILGTPAYYSGSYAAMPVMFTPADMTWTINRNLNVWYFSFDGDSRSGLNKVNIRVETPAHLYVAQDFTQSAGKGRPARLRAKKLTLSGDGADTFPIGRTLTLPQSPTGLSSTSIGMVTALAPTNVATTLELNNGADLTATSPALFSITNLLVTGTGESVLSGSFTFNMPENAVAVTLADGATLNFAGTFAEANPGTALAATGTGKVAIDISNWHLTGGIAAGNGVTLALVGDGTFATSVSGMGALEISVPVGHRLYVPASALSGWTGSQITVKSGTLLLDHEMSGVTVTTESGASVMYGGEFVVTDEVRTEATINVPAGQTLHIYGNGLTAATHVTLGGGTNVYFHALATIGATMEVVAGSDGAWVTSYFCVPSASVTGTVAGVVSSGSGYSTLATDGPGCVVFGGGGELFANSRFEVHGGSSAILTGGVYRVGSTGCVCTYWRGVRSGSVWIGDWGKYLGIRDGGRLEFAASANERATFFAEPLSDTQNYARSATLEIGEGGTVILGNNCRTYVGGNQRSGELILSGGTMRTGTGCGIYLGYNGYSVGTFRFNGGLLDISTPFRKSDVRDQSLVYWNGGTLKLGANYSSDSIMTGDLMSDNATRKFSVGILGDCTIDLEDMPTNWVFNTQQMSNRGEWYGNGTLTVKGGKTLYMRSMPNDINLRLEDDGTQVVLSNDARFFDFAKCTQYCVWRRPYSSGGTDSSDNYSSHDLGLEVEGFSVPLLTVTNGLPSLVNPTAARTVTVERVSILAGGCWDNAVTVNSALKKIDGLAMASNAIWHVTLAGSNTATATFDPLTLPSALGYQISGTGYSGELTLLSGVTALPAIEWTAIQPTRQYIPQVTANGMGLYLRGRGTTITIR